MTDLNFSMHADRALQSELKFVLSRDTAAAVRGWSRRELKPDPHAETGGDGYRVTSLYFDTDEFDTYFGRASYARAKYRIRRYNGAPIVFLERKLKAEGRVAKRRSPVALADLARIGGGDSGGHWFWRRLRRRRLQPACQIAYDRTARIGMSPTGPLRLTIDQEIAAVAIDTVAFADLSCADLLSGRAILELKYRVHVPILFERLIDEFRLEPRHISKYRLAVGTIGLAGEEKGTALYA